MKAKRSSRKREHSLNEYSEKIECSWQMKNGVNLSPKKHDVIQPFIAANKTKEN
jgi:hypothetical protein